VRVNQNESITLAVAGADVTIPAATLADLWIKKLLASSAQMTDSSMLIKQPPLADGEIYLGAIITPKIRKHIILLPGENADANWKHQMEWAASIGGQLFDRVEGALLFATMPEQFKKEAYWTREQPAAISGCAWYQGFTSGLQSSSDTDGKLPARAIRSESIE
jgi:hypothetical protein